MIRIALAMARIGGLVVVFVAVLGGMALLTATGVIVDSGFRSQLPLRLVQAEVMVSARQSIPVKEDLPVALPERAPVPGSLVGVVREVPGVAAAVGDLSFPAAVVSGTSPPVPGGPATAGHGWSSLSLSGRLTAGRVPRGQDEISLRDGRLGERLRVVAGGRPATYRVTALVDAPGLYFSDAAAATLAGRTSGGRAGTVDLVAVRAAAGVSPDELARTLRQRLGDRYEIATGRYRSDAESPGAVAGRGLLLVLPGSIGGVSLMIVGFVVGGGLSLSINRQRRELALLRAAGATPRQVRRVVAVQGLAAAAPALAPGAALGYFLAARLGDLLVGIGALRADQPLVYGPLPAIAAALLLLGVVRVASWAASLRVSRMPVVSGVADLGEPSPFRTNAGLLLILASLVLSGAPLAVRTEAAAIGPATAAPLAVIGLALAGPRLVQRAAGALARSRFVARLSGPCWLAVHNTHGHALRTAGAVAALGMVVTLGLSVTLTQTTLAEARSAQAAPAMRGLVTITAPSLSGIPRGLLEEVRELTPAAGMVTTTVVTGPLAFADNPRLTARPVLGLGPDAEGLVDLDLVDGALSRLTGAAVALDEQVGRVGERLDVIMGDGARVEATVVATYRRGLAFGPIVVSRDLAAAHTTTGLDSAIMARPAALAPLLARWPAVEVTGATQGPQAGVASGQALVNLAVLAVLLAYLLVAVANRLVATTTARRDELDVLRRLGATPRQLRRMIRWEAVLIAAGASGAGIVLAAVPLVMLGIGFLSRPVPAGPLWLVPGSVLVVGLVVWLAVELPARRIR
ncbi:FtsX-like permease family protein [Nonomuraea jiangxiensis]|uniref:Putative ABC transport system permease protein n=1 Tax=Nonomuraea jiangxiensis TaxID=633440 RepID=A0A1G9ICD5_9ACTN|nr:FtsX-like permease family protein [Nonomuraea jiangxiensis]SDL22493.1 putative ABC transport system permease protein [Nonomuraea jiangxiensis]